MPTSVLHYLIFYKPMWLWQLYWHIFGVATSCKRTEVVMVMTHPEALPACSLNSFFFKIEKITFTFDSNDEKKSISVYGHYLKKRKLIKRNSEN